MKEIKFRTLGADLIEVRPTDTKEKGRCTLLLYQTARCPMEILDETFPGAWACDYKEVAGDVYCGIGIKVDEEWIWRWNAGVEGNIGEGKSRASDAFKRSATMWGIGRELYSTPKVKINCPDSYYYNDKMTMSFSVKEIEWDENRRCKTLVIADRFGKVIYSWSKDATIKESAQEPLQLRKDKPQVLKDFCSAIKKQEGIDKEDLLRFYNYWLPRVENWDERPFIPEKLWSRWCQTKRN